MYIVHTMYGYTLYIVESPECSNCEQWAMHNANSERLWETLHPIHESAQQNISGA